MIYPSRGALIRVRQHATTLSRVRQKSDAHTKSDIETPSGRRRAGVIALVAGAVLVVIFAALSALTGNGTWFLDASPIYALSLTLVLVLLTTPPKKGRR